jgi:hypothetical protein
MTRTIDVDNVSIDFSKWIVHDGIQDYVNKLSKKIEIPSVNLPSEAKEDYDHGRRLADIYHKFIETFAKMEN